MHGYLHDKNFEDEKLALTKELCQGLYKRLEGLLSRNHEKKGEDEEGQTPPKNQGSTQTEEKRRVAFPMTQQHKQSVKVLRGLFSLERQGFAICKK